MCLPEDKAECETGHFFDNGTSLGNRIAPGLTGLRQDARHRSPCDCRSFAPFFTDPPSDVMRPEHEHHHKANIITIYIILPPLKLQGEKRNRRRVQQMERLNEGVHIRPRLVLSLPLPSQVFRPQFCRDSVLDETLLIDNNWVIRFTVHHKNKRRPGDKSSQYQRGDHSKQRHPTFGQPTRGGFLATGGTSCPTSAKPSRETPTKCTASAPDNTPTSLNPPSYTSPWFRTDHEETAKLQSVKVNPDHVPDPVGALGVCHTNEENAKCTNIAVNSNSNKDKKTIESLLFA